MTVSEDEYLCVGVCMADTNSGYCLGCGRPPLPGPARNMTAAPAQTAKASTVFPYVSDAIPTDTA